MACEHELLRCCRQLRRVLGEDALGIPDDDLSVSVSRGKYMPLDNREPDLGDFALAVQVSLEVLQDHRAGSRICRLVHAQVAVDQLAFTVHQVSNRDLTVHIACCHHRVVGVEAHSVCAQEGLFVHPVKLLSNHVNDHEMAAKLALEAALRCQVGDL